MNWEIILGIVVLMIIALSPISAILRLIPSIFLGLIFRGNGLVNGFLSAVIIWYIIGYIWHVVYQQPCPLIAFVLSVVVLIVNGQINKERLSDVSKMNLSIEVWGIIVAGIIHMMNYGFVIL